jgi:hypothetical protein
MVLGETVPSFDVAVQILGGISAGRVRGMRIAMVDRESAELKILVSKEFLF